MLKELDFKVRAFGLILSIYIVVLSLVSLKATQPWQHMKVCLPPGQCCLPDLILVTLGTKGHCDAFSCPLVAVFDIERAAGFLHLPLISYFAILILLYFVFSSSLAKIPHVFSIYSQWLFWSHGAVNRKVFVTAGHVETFWAKPGSPESFASFISCKSWVAVDCRLQHPYLQAHREKKHK